MRYGIGITLAIVAGLAWAASWLPLDDSRYEYDPTTLRRIQNGYALVMIRFQLSPENVEKSQEDAARSRRPADYSKYAYSTNLLTFNCTMRRYRIREGWDYALDGSVLHHFDDTHTKEYEINPDSKIADAIRGLCRRLI
jgi:hypothetical protein